MDGGTDSDDYAERISNFTIEQCIEAFNRDVGKEGWVSARGRFHLALMERFLDSEYDCSDFISLGTERFGQAIFLDGGGSIRGSMKVNKKISIERGSIVQI